MNKLFYCEGSWLGDNTFASIIYNKILLTLEVCMKDFRPFLEANFRGQLLFLISNKFKGLLILNKFCSTDVYKYVLNYIWEKNILGVHPLCPHRDHLTNFQRLHIIEYIILTFLLLSSFSKTSLLKDIFDQLIGLLALYNP